MHGILTQDKFEISSKAQLERFTKLFYPFELDLKDRIGVVPILDLLRQLRPSDSPKILEKSC